VYSPGSPLFHPNGTHILNKLIAFLRAQYRLFGFREVLTPTIYKKSLWQVSGHWQNYKDDMYEVLGRGASGTAAEEGGQEQVAGELGEVGEDESYGLKPMNCPGHCLLFKGQKWSYRQLPVRYADFSPLHRNEISGALSGLTRVRRFHQDDGHIFCRPHQIGREIELALKFTDTVLQTFGLGEYRLVLSTRPEKDFIGSVELWDNAESQLRAALEQSGKKWEINEGDGAFYGPKIDLQIADAQGKFHQLSTIQLDMNLPQRFELEYTTAEGEPDYDPATQGRATPVLIHRAIFGSLERFFALLVERYEGLWPFWLSPRQGIILTVNQDDEVLRAVRNAAAKMSGFELVSDHGNSGGVSSEVPAALKPLSHLDATFNIDIDTSGRSMAKKFRSASINRYNIVFVLGPMNLADGSVDVDLSAQMGRKSEADVRKMLAGVPGWDVKIKTQSRGTNRVQMKMKVEDVHDFLVKLERDFN
jgi:threonyl-tRNA synthetase